MAEERPDLTEGGKKPELREERRGDVPGDRRLNAMFVAAYVAICCLVYITVWNEKLGEYAQGVVTLVLGMFLNELKNMYSFELGATRSAAKKDEAIADMTKAASVAANTAQATQDESKKMINIALAAPPGTTGADVAAIAGTAPDPAVPVVTPGPETAGGVTPAAEVVAPKDKA